MTLRPRIYAALSAELERLKYEPIKLWLDDVRAAPPGWVWAHDVTSAAEILNQSIVSVEHRRRYTIVEMSLDHDLNEWGDSRTGYDFVKSYVLHYVNERALAPFVWRCHSQNPVGRQNIEFVMHIVEKLWAEQAWPEDVAEIPL